MGTTNVLVNVNVNHPTIPHAKLGTMQFTFGMKLPDEDAAKISYQVVVNTTTIEENKIFLEVIYPLIKNELNTKYEITSQFTLGDLKNVKYEFNIDRSHVNAVVALMERINVYSDFRVFRYSEGSISYDFSMSFFTNLSFDYDKYYSEFSSYVGILKLV